MALFIGKRAFIAGVADDNGYGWAIAKSLAAAGAEILLGTWVPVSYYVISGKNWYLSVNTNSLGYLFADFLNPSCCVCIPVLLYRYIY
jgi:enoyl-[acyl-carrier-protein] reductase (NADH)